MILMQGIYCSDGTYLITIYSTHFKHSYGAHILQIMVKAVVFNEREYFSFHALLLLRNHTTCQKSKAETKVIHPSFDSILLSS